MTDGNIAELNIALTAKIGGMQRKLDRIEKRVFSFQKRISKGFGFAKKAAVAFVAAIGARKLVGAFNRSREELDKFAKTADKLGASTEALAGLQHAGEQTGVSIKTMNMAMQRATRRISEAAKGTGEAKDAIRELGLNASELNKLPLDEKMGQLSDAMLRFGNQSDRVRLSMKLFDSEGVALVNTMALGSDGLKAMADEADALGLALSRAEASKVESMNDALDRAGKVFQGITRRVTAKLAPVVEGLANLFVEWAKSTKTSDSVIANMSETLGYVLAQVFKVVNFGKMLVNALQQAVVYIKSGFIASWERLVGLLGNAGTIFTKVGELFQEALENPMDALELAFIGMMEFLTSELSRAINQFQGLADNLGFGDRFAEEAAVVERAADNFYHMRRAMEKTNPVAKQFAELQEAIDKALAKSNTATAKGDAEIAKLRDEMRKLTADWVDSSEKAKAWTRAVVESADAAAKAKTAAKDEEGTPSGPDTFLKAFRESAQKRLDLLKTAGVNELEQFKINEQMKIFALEELKLTDLERKDEINDLILQKENELQEAITWKEAAEHKRRFDMRTKFARMTLSGASSMFKNLATLQESSTKSAQRLGKAAAKVSIVADTATAAMRAYSAMAGIPVIGPALGAAAAAAAMVAGAQRLRESQSGTTIGGSGGTPPAGGASADTPDTSTGNVGGIATPAETELQRTRLVIPADRLISGADLAEMVNEEGRRGFIFDGVVTT